MKNAVPTRYVTTEVNEVCSIDMPINCFSPQQQEQMDDLIREGIHHWTGRDRDSSYSLHITSHYAEPLSAEDSPSSWFG
jgi:hypothetical protein